MPVKILLLLLIAGCCSTVTIAQSRAQVKQNRAVAEREETEKLEKAWYHFADALLSKDTAALKAMATNCIRCTNCPENADSGKVITTADEDQYGTRSVPFGQFLTVYGPYIFDNRTISRLKDPSMLHFIDNEYNAGHYAVPCIIVSSGLKSPHHKEVLLTFIDRSPDFEGAQHAFAFIETKEGYKLCGYSTIP